MAAKRFVAITEVCVRFDPLRGESEWVKFPVHLPTTPNGAWAEARRFAKQAILEDRRVAMRPGTTWHVWCIKVVHSVHEGEFQL